MKVEPPKRSRPAQVVVDLKGLREPWAEWCQARGLTTSEAVRLVLGHVLDESDTAAPMKAPPNGSGRRKRIEVSLASGQYAAAAEAARRSGMSLSRWLHALVFVQLVRSTPFGEAEIEALTRSSQALLAIGRNVNQIARGLREAPGANPISLAQIKFISDLIRTHTDKVSDLLSANSQRWRP